MVAVSYETSGNIAILTIDNPPVNALSHAVREGLVATIKQANSDPAFQAIVIICNGETFIAGADIREFGKPPVAPTLSDLRDVMDATTKPLIAALHGTVLGGGLEIALVCTGRIAAANTRFGLPEVKLGILPGASGTQRLPRVAGPMRALSMILSGEPVDTDTALAEGIIDEVAKGDLRDAAIDFASRSVDRPLVRVRDRTDRISNVDLAIFEEARAKLARSSSGLIAPSLIVDCIEAACSRPFDEGMAMERAALNTCMDSPQRAALIHLFFAERTARKVPGLEGVKPKPIHQAAVIGAGTMGGGIAMCFANAGIPVTVLDVSQGALDRGRAAIENNYATSVKRGSLSEERRAAAVDLIDYSTSYDDIAQADIAIEAVFEDIELKQEIFRKLDAVLKPGAILASNTSTLDLDRIADATARPQNVIGTHFFSPANVMRLLEIVRGAKSSPETIATGMELGKLLGKVTVLAGNCDGFIANRMQAPFGNAVDRLIEEGASPQQIDRVMKEFGCAMGPLAVRDLIGLDTSWRIRDQRRRLRPGSQPPTPLLDRLYHSGRLGQKSGAGYYRYEGRQALPDPEVDCMIDDIAVDLGIERQPVEDSEILDRLLCALVNEAAHIVDEGIAVRSSDVDLAYVYGYGFPNWVGGPMHWAKEAGLAGILAKIKGYQSRFGASWTPSPLLERAAEQGAWPK